MKISPLFLVVYVAFISSCTIYKSENTTILEVLKVAQGFELSLQSFDIQQVFLEQVVVNEGTDIRERAERQSLNDLGGEGIFELTEAVEQMDAVVFEAGKNTGAGIGRQGEVFEMTLEGARVEELTWCFEEP